MSDLYHLVFNRLNVLGSSEPLERAAIAGVGWLVRDRISGSITFVPDARGTWRASMVEETTNESSPTGATIRVIHPNAREH